VFSSRLPELPTSGAPSKVRSVVADVLIQTAPRGIEDDFEARLAAAEPGALRVVYEQHHVALRAFARRLVGDNATAEDLVHDAFVALPAAMARFRGDCSLRTFLMGIATNLSRRAIRSAVRQRRAMGALAQEPERQAPPPNEDVERRQLADELTRALDQLPHRQRVAFVLCEVEELNSRQAATLAGVPEGTMRTRLFHAKKKLRTLLRHPAQERRASEGHR
jgi:RNA polymerase sigma-70 factor, ECF subfamily